MEMDLRFDETILLMDIEVFCMLISLHAVDDADVIIGDGL
jgi:hypothetical protein